MIIGNSSRSRCVWFWLWVHTSEHARCPACVCTWWIMIQIPPLPSLTPAGIRVIIDHRTVCVCVRERDLTCKRDKTGAPLQLLLWQHDGQPEWNREREGGRWNHRRGGRRLSSYKTDSHTRWSNSSPAATVTETIPQDHPPTINSHPSPSPLYPHLQVLKFLVT